ncbi:MAG: dTMP kinase [Nanoarchaeota archaeon]|nr:dTMP kinase [Nanoarchaeota archaeon]
MNLFYSFEGFDGCGKGTQIKRVNDYLIEKGLDVYIAREPGSTSDGEAIRKLLKRPGLTMSILNNSEFKDHSDYNESPLDENNLPVNKRHALTEALLFLAARSEFYRHIIKPRLEEGVIVIADRFMDSTWAYQGYGRLKGDEKVLRFIEDAHSLILEEQYPIVTFFLDIQYNIMIERLANDGRDPNDLFESLPREFFERVREGYFKLAEREPNRFQIIDGRLAPEEIFSKYIQLSLDERLS